MFTKMTSLTSQYEVRRPLGDKTNSVLNMKCNKNEQYMLGSKQIRIPIISLDVPTKKSATIKKKNTLFDATVYEIGNSPKVNAKENMGSKKKYSKVKPLNRTLSENDISIVIQKEREIFGKKELLIKVTRIPEIKNCEEGIGQTVVKKSITRKRSKSLDKVAIQNVNAKSFCSNYKCNHNEKGSSLKETTDKENKQLNDLSATNIEESNHKNPLCTKKLIVEILKIRDIDKGTNMESTVQESSRIRRKNVFLDESIYQIDRSIIQSFNNIRESIGNGNKDEILENCKDAISEMKERGKKPSEKDVGVENGNNIKSSKELFVEITPITHNMSSSNKIGEEQQNNLGHNHMGDKTHLKDLYIDFTNVLDTNNSVGRIIESHQKKSLENYKTTGKTAVNNTESPKNLVDIPQHSNNTNKVNNGNKEQQPDNLGNSNITQKETKVCKSKNIKCFKELSINIARIPDENNLYNRNIEKQQKNNTENSNIKEKPLKSVNLLTKVKESHNLRKLEPKNYLEESFIDTTDNSNSAKPVDKPVANNLSRNDGVPIYRKLLPDESKNNNQHDLYEFVDFSPKSKKIEKRRRPHRSSIIFDKNTHDILQKIQEKEARLKRKIAKKINKKPIPKKRYDKIVDNIVSNVKEKIKKKNKTEEKNIEKQGQNNAQNILSNQEIVPLNDSHTRVIQVNSLIDEMSIIVHHPAEVPLYNEKSVPQGQNSAKYKENVTLRGQKVVKEVQPDRIVINNVLNKENIITKNNGMINTLNNENIMTRKNNMIMTLINEKNNMISTLNNENVTTRRNNTANMPHLDTFNRIRGAVNVTPPVSPSIPFDNISVCSDAGSDDINNCFGFNNDDDIPPVISTPKKAHSKGAVKILENITLRRGNQNVESPIDFNFRRPNANSTMVHIGAQNIRTSSPWRPSWINVKHNPHFVSVKTNALPRIDQDVVIDHTLVEEFESRCSNTNTPKRGNETPGKKGPVQQSILDFIDCNIEKENEPAERSLYDYEAFNSPEKKRGKENHKVEAVKRNLLGKSNIVSSTPIRRKVLGDITNSSGEQTIIQNSSEITDNTYFGFNDSPVKSIQEKRRNKDQIPKENIENDAAKPSRFDLNALRSYSAKNKKNKKVVSSTEQQSDQVPDESVSIMQISADNQDEPEIRLFEEPDEIFNIMSPPQEKKHRRKRLDSCDSEVDEASKKRKRHKKTKLEIDQEKWIEQFNQECAQTDQHELDLD